MRKCRFCLKEIDYAVRVCPHCDKDLVPQSPEANGVADAGTTHIEKRDAPTKFFWIACATVTILGGGFSCLEVLFAKSAPQEAAAASVGCLLIIGAYVFARTVDELTK